MSYNDNVLNAVQAANFSTNSANDIISNSNTRQQSQNNNNNGDDDEHKTNTAAQSTTTTEIQQQQPSTTASQQQSTSSSSSSSNQIYRLCSLGKALVRTLTECVSSNDFTTEDALYILNLYEQLISYRLHNNVDISCNIHGDISSFRHIDYLWQFQLKQCHIKYIDQVNSLQTDIQLKNTRVVANQIIDNNTNKRK